MSTLFSAEVNGDTGNELYCIVDGGALEIKALTVEIEDGSPLGRLFDMDVLDETGRHVGREELGLDPRRCLLCGNPAKECARARVHTVEELQAKTETILLEVRWDEDSEAVARLACQSLLYEVCTTPKPGLVDCRNSGSHRDMDLFTFLSSSTALYPYFRRCARLGMETAAEAPEITFSCTRREGRRAERTMLAASGGVNTHKGAIFSMGILCAALGRLPRSEWRDPARVLRACASMAAGITWRDLGGVTAGNAKTAGERLYASYGVTGVRGQAEAGFPAVLEAGLSVLEKGAALGIKLQDAGSSALLAIIAATDDTNLIARGGREAQLRIREKLAALLEETPFPSQETLCALDDDFIVRNLSPGGSADLLAMSYFLYFLKHEEERHV